MNMNGETAELCTLTACARYALKRGKAFNYTVEKYINSESFLFVSHDDNITEKSAEKWFDRLLSLGLTDIFMLLPLDDKRRALHGFANSSGGCVLCFFKSGNVTCFVPKWSFDNKIHLWNIEFTEFNLNDTPKEIPRFSDNTDEFKTALLNITEFAEKLGEKFWADIFRKAQDILNGNLAEGSGLPELPEKNLRLYSAAACAEVFGAMGSWNDSPAYSAREKGLSDDFNKLSNELFIQIEKALLFAVNEFR